MKKLALLLFVAILASCSDDSDDRDFKTSCKCSIVYRDGTSLPVSLTNCSYNGRVISEVIGNKYVCE